MDRKVGTYTSSELFNTGVASGVAFSWTTECHRHKGKTVPFEKDSKYSEPSAMRVVSTPGVRHDLQTILNGMIADVSPQASGKFHAWHHTTRDCTWCEEEGRNSVQALHKLRVHEDGPSHFFVQTQVQFRSKRRGTEVTEGVSPSFSVEVFGKSYHMCAIVYSTGGGHHFVSQVYLPEHKCWVLYDDVRSSEAHCYAKFDPLYERGHEHMFLYIEQDVLERLGCIEVQSPPRGLGTSTQPKSPSTNIPSLGKQTAEGGGRPTKRLRGRRDTGGGSTSGLRRETDNVRIQNL